MMSLHARPVILSNLTPDQVFKSNTFILHALSSDVPTLTLQYWITTRSILPMFTQDSQEAGYNVLYFTPFSIEVAWTRLYPDQPISNTISVRHTEKAPSTFPSLALLISTSPTLVTTPSYNSFSNPTVNPTTALIALMQQILQRNATMMAHMHARPSPPLSPQPPTSQQYKRQRLPFPKWYKTPPTTLLFLAQVPT